MELKVSSEVEQRLRCPACHAELRRAESELVCGAASCGRRYPVVHGVAVLIDEASSVFSIADFTAGHSTTLDLRMSTWKRALSGFLPDVSRNVTYRDNFLDVASTLLVDKARSRVLVLGGSIVGLGMEVLVENPAFELVETDVSHGPRTQLICDAHSIPFDDGSFDGVVITAVLEHVVDPHRCVSEIYRVLRDNGIVYAETPFMQQVHMGRHDFTRFTHLGHRRLFRAFDEIKSGAACGPGMAMAWSWQYFLMSFASTRRWRSCASVVARLTAFWLPWLDGFLVRRAGSYDAASTYYFLGRKSGRVLSDRDLIAGYRGMNAVSR